MIIILMDIVGYSITAYWCLLMTIILVRIGGYYINAIDEYFVIGYWWLLMVIILVSIGGYSINGY
jgi:hypothetical protein